MTTMTDRPTWADAGEVEGSPLEEFLTDQQVEAPGGDAAEDVADGQRDSTGITRFLVVGGLPGVGASTVAWSIASAAARMTAGQDDITVTDAAAPRRSALRMIGGSTGLAAGIDPHTRLVPARSGRIVTTYVDGRMDTRVDEGDLWPASTAPTQIVDLGLSAEEALSDDAAATWLTGDTAIGSHVVLVLPSNASTQLRCEALLSEWVSREWAPIDDIVLVGPATTPVGGTHFMQQAMSSARQLDYLPELAQRGLPAADAALTGPAGIWARLGHELVASACGLPLPETGSRRWRKARP